MSSPEGDRNFARAKEGASMPAMTKEEQIRADTDRLHQMGYAQQLFRDMGGFSNFAISFTIISVLTGGLTLYGYGLNHGGPQQMGIGWLVVGIMVLVVAAVMAQLASALPTAGALYYQAAKLGNKHWGWITGWFNLAGQITISTGIIYGNAIFAAALLNSLFNYPADVTTTAGKIGVISIFAILLAVQATINHVGVRLAARAMGNRELGLLVADLRLPDVARVDARDSGPGQNGGQHQPGAGHREECVGLHRRRAALRWICDRPGLLRPELNHLELADALRLQPRWGAAGVQMAPRGQQEVPDAGPLHLGGGDHRLHPGAGAIPGPSGLLDRRIDFCDRALRLVRHPGPARPDLSQPVEAGAVEPRPLVADRRLGCDHLGGVHQCRADAAGIQREVHRRRHRLADGNRHLGGSRRGDLPHRWRPLLPPLGQEPLQRADHHGIGRRHAQVRGGRRKGFHLPRTDDYRTGTDTHAATHLTAWRIQQRSEPTGSLLFD